MMRLYKYFILIIMAVLLSTMMPYRLLALETLTDKELTGVSGQSGITMILQGANPRMDLLAGSEGGSGGYINLTSPATTSHYLEFIDDTDADLAAVSISGADDANAATIDSLRLTLDTYTRSGESGVILQAHDWDGEVYIKADAIQANDDFHANNLFGLSIGQIELMDFDGDGGPSASLSVQSHAGINDWGVSGAGIDMDLFMEIYVEEFALYPSTGTAQGAKDIVLAKEFNGSFLWDAETADTDPIGTWDPTGSFLSDGQSTTRPMSLDFSTDTDGNGYISLFLAGNHTATYTYPASEIATYGDASLYAPIPDKTVSYHIGAGRVARVGNLDGLQDGVDHVGGLSIAANFIYTKVVIPVGNRKWTNPTGVYSGISYDGTERYNEDDRNGNPPPEDGSWVFEGTGLVNDNETVLISNVDFKGNPLTQTIDYDFRADEYYWVSDGLAWGNGYYEWDYVDRHPRFRYDPGALPGTEQAITDVAWDTSGVNWNNAN
ncbi:MAG: hypothetical protein SWH68_08580 [Thermodesulfobacteriota bacterium]|nr:hypothetical protein [Thermodesulfobacteriota bacterium]